MLKRDRLFYEQPEGGGGAPDPDPGDTTDADRGWQPTEEWGSRIDGFIAQSQPVLEQLAEVMALPPEAFQPDGNINADEPEGDLDIEQIINKAVEDRLGAFTPMLGQIAEREGEQIARTALEGLKGEIGSFDDDDAILLTRAYMDQGMEAQAALRQAATRAHERGEQIRTQAIEEYKTQLLNAAGAPPDPGATGISQPGQQVPRGPGRYEEVVRNYESALNPEL